MSVKNDTSFINGFNEYNFNVYIMRKMLVYSLPKGTHNKYSVDINLL